MNSHTALDGYQLVVRALSTVSSRRKRRSACSTR